MIKKSPFGFIRSMTKYGIYLGFLVSAVGAIILTVMMHHAFTDWVVIGVRLVVFTVIGVIIGSLYGVMAGFCSGLMMRITTQLCFREIRRTWLYKVTMGATTLLTTGIIFSATGLSSMFIAPEFGQGKANPMFQGLALEYMIPDDAWIALVLMALVFAVYASQRVAQQYLRETDVRKSKHKVT